MTETISTLDLRQTLGDVLNRISLRHDKFIIARKGKPLAAMIPIQQLENLERVARKYLLEALDQQSSALSADDALKLANEGKHRTRKQKKGRRNKGVR